MPRKAKTIMSLSLLRLASFSVIIPIGPGEIYIYIERERERDGIQHKSMTLDFTFHINTQ